MLGYQTAEEVEDIVAAALPVQPPLNARMLLEQAAEEEPADDSAAAPDPDEPAETPDEQPPAVNDRTLATELGLDDHPGQAKAGEIIAEIEAAGAIIDVNSIVARHGEDIEALPDDLQVKIEIAADQRKNAIKAERETAGAK
jgi:hypothetical protein